MTIHRFFVSPQCIDEANATVICQSQKLVRQIRKVLRLENGDRLDILDGQGNIYHCTLQNFLPRISPEFFQAKIIDKEKGLEQTGIKFTVALPLIKASRFEWALEKLTELGVNKIVPVALSRSIIQPQNDMTYRAERLDPRPGKQRRSGREAYLPSGLAAETIDLKDQAAHKLIRWHKIIEEAAEQCERSHVPDLVAPLRFLDWLSQYEPAQDSALRLICTERRTAQSLEEILYNRKNEQINSTLDCAIAVGAEGGFSENEIQAALARRFIPVSLGSHILRTETAAIYALSISTALLAKKNAGAVK